MNRTLIFVTSLILKEKLLCYSLINFTEIIFIPNSCMENMVRFSGEWVCASSAAPCSLISVTKDECWASAALLFIPVKSQSAELHGVVSTRFCSNSSICGLEMFFVSVTLTENNFCSLMTVKITEGNHFKGKLFFNYDLINLHMPAFWRNVQLDTCRGGCLSAASALLLSPNTWNSFSFSVEEKQRHGWR